MCVRACVLGLSFVFVFGFGFHLGRFAVDYVQGVKLLRVLVILPQRQSGFWMIEHALCLARRSIGSVFLG